MSGTLLSDAPAMEQAAPSDPAQVVVAVDGVSLRFGGVRALDDVSFSVRAGDICGIIGPNGAGKTTLFNCVSGLYRPTAGRVSYRGRDLAGVPIHAIAALGVGRTFQNLALFRTMDVRRNVAVGAHARTAGGFLAEALSLPAARRAEAETSAAVDRLLDMLDLSSVARTSVADLPFATLKRVELGRALASRPSLLLLDEPAAGLNHEGVEELLGLILRVREELDLTVLLVEHHMNLVMRASDQVVALNFGRKIADGIPSVVRSDPEVIRAYLGGDA